MIIFERSFRKSAQRTDVQFLPALHERISTFVTMEKPNFPTEIRAPSPITTDLTVPPVTVANEFLTNSKKLCDRPSATKVASTLKKFKQYLNRGDINYKSTTHIKETNNDDNDDEMPDLVSFPVPKHAPPYASKPETTDNDNINHTTFTDEEKQIIDEHWQPQDDSHLDTTNQEFLEFLDVKPAASARPNKAKPKYNLKEKSIINPPTNEAWLKRSTNQYDALSDHGDDELVDEHIDAKITTTTTSPSRHHAAISPVKTMKDKSSNRSRRSSNSNKSITMSKRSVHSSNSRSSSNMSESKESSSIISPVNTMKNKSYNRSKNSSKSSKSTTTSKQSIHSNNSRSNSNMSESEESSSISSRSTDPSNRKSIHSGTTSSKEDNVHPPPIQVVHEDVHPRPPKPSDTKYQWAVYITAKPPKGHDPPMYQAVEQLLHAFQIMDPDCCLFHDPFHNPLKSKCTNTIRNRNGLAITNFTEYTSKIVKNDNGTFTGTLWFTSNVTFPLLNKDPRVKKHRTTAFNIQIKVNNIEADKPVAAGFFMHKLVNPDTVDNAILHISERLPANAPPFQIELGYLIAGKAKEKKVVRIMQVIANDSDVQILSKMLLEQYNDPHHMTFIKQITFQWSDDDEKMKYVQSQQLFEQRNRSFTISNIKNLDISTINKTAEGDSIKIGTWLSQIKAPNGTNLITTISKPIHNSIEVTTSSKNVRALQLWLRHSLAHIAREITQEQWTDIFIDTAEIGNLINKSEVWAPPTQPIFFFLQPEITNKRKKRKTTNKLNTRDITEFPPLAAPTVVEWQPTDRESYLMITKQHPRKRKPRNNPSSQVITTLTVHNPRNEIITTNKEGQQKLSNDHQHQDLVISDTMSIRMNELEAFNHNAIEELQVSINSYQRRHTELESTIVEQNEKLSNIEMELTQARESQNMQWQHINEIRNSFQTSVLQQVSIKNEFLDQFKFLKVAIEQLTITVNTSSKSQGSKTSDKAKPKRKKNRNKKDADLDSDELCTNGSEDELSDQHIVHPSQKSSVAPGSANNVKRTEGSL